MNISWLTREDFLIVPSKKILPTHIVLDVGAGIQPQKLFVPTVHLIIEPYLPYIERIIDSPNEIPRKVFFQGTWDKVMPLFPDRSLDSIFAFDVIEHFEKEDGMKFIKEAERIARTQIAIFTPLGLYPQSYESEGETDRWGMGGGYWQSHRSGWEPGDFGAGWDFFVCKEFHLTGQHGEILDQPFGAFWAIKTIDDKVAPFENRYHIPELQTSLLSKAVYKRAISIISEMPQNIIAKIKSRFPRKLFSKIKKAVRIK